MRSLFTYVLVATVLTSFSQEIELVIPTGHTSQVKRIATSPDSSYVASIQNTSAVTLWDRKDGEIERVINLHTGRVNDLLFHKNNLITAGIDKKIILWNVQTKELEKLLNHSQEVISIFNTEDWLYAIGRNGKVIKWSLKDDSVDSLSIELDVIDAQFDPDLEQLVLGSRKELAVINTGTWNVEKHISFANDLATTVFNLDSSLLVGTTRGELLHIAKESGAELKRIKPFDFRLYHIEPLNADTLILSGRSKGSQLKMITYPDFKVIDPSLDLGNSSLLSEGGIQTFTIEETSILIPDYDYGIISFTHNFEYSNQYEGLSFPLNDIGISFDENLLAIASADREIKIYDLTGVRPPVLLEGHVGGVSSIAFHPSDSLVASVGLDNKLRIWNVKTGKSLYNYNIRGEYLNTPITFDVSGQYLIQKTSDEFFELFSLEKARSKKIKIKDGLKFRFFRNGEKILFGTRSGLYVYDAISLNEDRYFEMARARDFDVNGETIVILRGNQLQLYDLGFNQKKVIPLPREYDRIYLSPDQSFAIASINSAKKGSKERDYRLKLIDLNSGNIRQLEGHNGFTSTVKFLQNGKYMLSSSRDGQMIFWENGDKKGSLIPLKQSEWVAVTPKGIYDASQQAFDKMHYVRGKERFEMDQLKDLYYEPKLIPRLLGNISEPLPERKALSTIAPYPEVDIKYPQLNDGILGLNIKNNGGGVGWVVIKINGKEVLRELENNIDDDSVLVDYPIDGHPFLKARKLNKVSVKAYNGDGSVTSPERKFYYYGDHLLGKERVKPKLFGLIVGTDDYPGESMDLTYAGKDANDFASALSLASTNQYGAENTHITLLSTLDEDRKNWPTKQNIQTALQAIRERATAQDLLVIYLSGHGTNYMAEDREEFYYLTAEATDDLSNDEIREKTTVSTAELTNWIKGIPTLQQVLILDACHSGKITSEIEELATINTSQIKSLEKMKDRTGLYILAGSESDNVSFESSVYEQGLLTYSILFGMKGATHSEGGQINVIDLFQFVTKKVPELASEIGQIQMPEIKIPAESEAFSLGSISTEDQNKIKIVGSKPIFIQSGFQEQNQFNDPIHLGSKIDRKLLEISSKPERPLVFIDKKFFNSAYLIKGRYQLMDNHLKADIKIYKDSKRIKSFSVTAVNSKILADKIVNEALRGL